MKYIFVGKWIPGMKRFLDARFRNGIHPKARQRLQWWDWYMSHGHNISKTARHFGISRNTLYRWLKRFQPGCLSSLENSSTRPKTVRPRTIRLNIEPRVLELRKSYPRYGKKKLQVLLAQENVHASESSIGRIIKAWKLPDARKKHRSTTARLKTTILRERRPKGLNIKKPGEVIQMDSVIIQHNGSKLAIITALDLATRVGFAQAYRTTHAKAALEVFLKFQELLGTTIQAVHTDNGAEFLGVFHDYCQNNTIKHYFSQPRSPKQHAHVERFNRTLQDEGIQPFHLTLPLDSIREKLSAFLTNYNLFRPHAALHYLTPFRYYMTKSFPHFSSPHLFNRYWTNSLTRLRETCEHPCTRESVLAIVERDDWHSAWKEFKDGAVTAHVIANAGGIHKWYTSGEIDTQAWAGIPRVPISETTVRKIFGLSE